MILHAVDVATWWNTQNGCSRGRVKRAPLLVYKYRKICSSGRRVVNIIARTFHSSAMSRWIRCKPHLSVCMGLLGIPCECGKEYVGARDREDNDSISQRMTEHKRAVRNNDPNNALAVHVSKTHHKIEWEEANVLTREEYWTKRKIVLRSFRLRIWHYVSSLVFYSKFKD